MTPLSKAAEAVELVEGLGYSYSKAGNVVGLPLSTVSDILSGETGWDVRKSQPVFARYRSEQKARIEHAMTELTKKALIQAEVSVDKASFYQAVTGAAILVDKVRLLQGEPTQITANVSIQAVGSLDKLAAMFSSRLVNEDAVLVNQTPDTPIKSTI